MTARYVVAAVRASDDGAPLGTRRRIEPDVAERARLQQGARTDLTTSGTDVPEVPEGPQRTRDEVARTVDPAILAALLDLADMAGTAAPSD